jgi:hypothetical protein
MNRGHFSSLTRRLAAEVRYLDESPSCGPTVNESDRDTGNGITTAMLHGWKRRKRVGLNFCQQVCNPCAILCPTCSFTDQEQLNL